MLDQLDGMFAIALAGSHGLLLARDALGIKPLYYGCKGSTLLAASELKAFPPMDELNRLPAGHAMFATGKTWQFARTFPPYSPLITPPMSDILSEIRRRLDRAVVKRLMSDVPVGVYLSGEVDSSLVATLMRSYTVQLHSFTAGMAGAADIEATRQVARFLGTEHHELIYTADGVQAALPEVISHLKSFDAPLARFAVPMHFVSRLASEHVKVVFSGEGADELFAGYAYLAGIEDREQLRRELADITLRLQDTNLQRTDRMSMAATTLFIWPVAALMGKIQNPLKLFCGRRAALPLLVGGTFFGPFLGIFLSLVAIQHTNTGVAATLMSLMPILIIPLDFAFHHDKPSLRAVLGTVVAVAGVAILFLR